MTTVPPVPTPLDAATGPRVNHAGRAMTTMLDLVLPVHRDVPIAEPFVDALTYLKGVLGGRCSGTASDPRWHGTLRATRSGTETAPVISARIAFTSLSQFAIMRSFG